MSSGREVAPLAVRSFSFSKTSKKRKRKDAIDGNSMQLLASFLALVLTFTHALPPPPSSLIAPGTVFDFTSKWQLQTCWDSPRVVQGAALQTYSSVHFYLQQRAQNATLHGAAGIVFVTPDNSSAHTAHADHPRTEFRDISTPDWEWPTSQVETTIETTTSSAVSHRLSATLIVDHVAGGKKPWTIIGQIHGSVDEEIAKVIKLRWTGGLVEARVKVFFLISRVL